MMVAFQLIGPSMDNNLRQLSLVVAAIDCVETAHAFSNKDCS